MPTGPTRWLLVCGALSPILFVLGDVMAATALFQGYDYTSQQVSELSAIGAPSRPFWIVMSFICAALTVAFAAGVWRAAGSRRSLRIAAVLIGINAFIGLPWVLFAPMHLRGTLTGSMPATDVLHIAFTVMAVTLMVAYMTAGSAAFGWGFRIYSILSIAAMLIAGLVVGTQVSAIAAGLPTPWMGLVERISVYGPLTWVFTLALGLLARRPLLNPIGLSLATGEAVARPATHD